MRQAGVTVWGVPLSGHVEDFDVDRGLGRVRADGSQQLLGFHCTALADGTRTIEPGTLVVFSVVPGHRGQVEAAEITVCRGSQPVGLS